MNAFYLFYIAVFFLTASALAFIAFKSSGGGILAKTFMGVMAFLVMAGLGYFLFMFVVPAL